MRPKILFWSGLFCLSLLSLSGLEATDLGIQERVILEKTLQEKIQGITQKLLGNNEFLVWVDLQVNFEMTQQMKNVATPQKDPNAPAPPPQAETPEPSLPGISEAFLPAELKPAPFKPVVSMQPIIQEMAQTFKLPTAYVQRIRVRVLVPTDTDQIKVVDLKRLLPLLIGMERVRGDELIVESVPFRKDPMEAFLYWKDRLNPMVFWVFGLMMVTIFLFGPVRSFLNRFAHSMETFTIEGRLTAAMPGPLNVQATSLQGQLPMEALRQRLPGQAQGLLEGKTEGDEAPFSFITADNINKVSWILTEADPPTLATVAAYLPADLTSQFLATLPSEKSREVLLLLSSPQTVDPAVIKNLNDQLKAQAESVIGGVDQILQIMDQQPAEAQEAFLEELRVQRPDIVDEIQRRMLTLDKVARLERATLQNVLWEAYRQRIPLGIVLKGLPAQAQAACMAALPATLVRIVQDEIKQPANTAQQETERKRFMQVVRNLERAGRIQWT